MKSWAPDRHVHRSALAGFLVAVVAVSNLIQGAWSGVSVSPTFTGLATAALGVMVLFTPRRTSRANLAILALFAIALLMGFLAPALNDAATDKRQQIILTMMLPMLVIAFVPTRWQFGRAFAATVIALSILTAFLQFTTPDPLDLISGRRTPDGVNPIDAGRLLAAGALSSLVLLLASRRRTLKLALCGLAGFLFFCSALTASRGPIAAGVVVAAVIILTARHLILPMRLSAWAVAGGASYVLLTHGFEAHSRLTSTETSGRLALLRGTLQVIQADPLGIGWGNLYNRLPSSALIQSQGEVQYPHNLILEFAAEAGVISLPLLLIVVTAGFMGTNRLLDFEPLLFKGLIAFALLNSMVSTQVVGNRLLWVCLAVGIGAGGTIISNHREGQSTLHTNRTRTK